MWRVDWQMGEAAELRVLGSCVSTGVRSGEAVKWTCPPVRLAGVLPTRAVHPAGPLAHEEQRLVPPHRQRGQRQQRQEQQLEEERAEAVLWAGGQGRGGVGSAARSRAVRASKRKGPSEYYC